MEKEPVKKVEETQEGTQPAPQEATGSEEVKETVERTPRELLYERVRTSRPDIQYDDDEQEYYRQASAMMDDMESKAGKYDEMSQKMMARFSQSPEEAEAFLDILEGASIPAAIRRRMGDEALTMQEGSEGWDEYVKAGEDRKKQFEENRKVLESFMANAKDSDAVFTNFIAERGMDEAAADAFKDVVVSIANDMSAGRVSKDTLTMLLNAVNYEKDIAGAREQGEIDGKNKKIEVEKKRMAGSGLPDAATGGSSAAEVDAKTSNNDTANWLGGMPKRK